MCGDVGGVGGGAGGGGGVWRGGRGRAFLKKIQRNLACVYTRFFLLFFVFCFSLVVVREREREIDREK